MFPFLFFFLQSERIVVNIHQILTDDWGRRTILGNAKCHTSSLFVLSRYFPLWSKYTPSASFSVDISTPKHIFCKTYVRALGISGGSTFKSPWVVWLYSCTTNLKKKKTLKPDQSPSSALGNNRCESWQRLRTATAAPSTHGLVWYRGSSSIRDWTKEIRKAFTRYQIGEIQEKKEKNPAGDKLERSSDIRATRKFGSAKNLNFSNR